ncbi:hypothetical protein FRC10_005482 [Ceratobasidium sp. 414]|nr:hypothetical protein FRC10_005482 [Ceratobasidium sp. 414]
MFATKFALAALSMLSAVFVARAAPTGPTGLSPREDWKTELGWDGKVTTPAELDPSNAVKPTPGKPAAAANVGVYFCTDANFQGRCLRSVRRGWVGLQRQRVELRTRFWLDLYYLQLEILDVAK